MPTVFTPSTNLASFDPKVRERLFTRNLPVEELFALQDQELARSTNNLKAAQENYENLTKVTDDLLKIDLENEPQQEIYNALRKKHGLDEKTINQDPEWFNNRANVALLKQKVKRLTEDPQFEQEIIEQQLQAKQARDHIATLDATNPQLAAIMKRDYETNYGNLKFADYKNQKINGVAGAKKLNKAAYVNHDVEKIINDLIDTLPEGIEYKRVSIPGGNDYFAIETETGTLSKAESIQYLNGLIKRKRTGDRSIDNAFKAYVAANNFGVDGKGDFDENSEQWMAQLFNMVSNKKTNIKSTIKATPVPKAAKTTGSTTTSKNDQSAFERGKAALKAELERQGLDSSPLDLPGNRKALIDFSKKAGATFTVSNGKISVSDPTGKNFGEILLSEDAVLAANSNNYSAADLSEYTEIVDGKTVIKGGSFLRGGPDLDSIKSKLKDKDDISNPRLNGADTVKDLEKVIPGSRWDGDNLILGDAEVIPEAPTPSPTPSPTPNPTLDEPDFDALLGGETRTLSAGESRTELDLLLQRREDLINNFSVSDPKLDAEIKREEDRLGIRQSSINEAEVLTIEDQIERVKRGERDEAKRQSKREEIESTSVLVDDMAIEGQNFLKKTGRDSFSEYRFKPSNIRKPNGEFSYLVYIDNELQPIKSKAEVVDMIIQNNLIAR